MTIGEIVKKCRIGLGLTQEQLAEKVKASRQSIGGGSLTSTNPRLKISRHLSRFYI